MLYFDHKTAYNNAEHNSRATCRKKKKESETNRPTLFKILIV